MDRLAWCTANRAHGKRFWNFFRIAIIALGNSLEPSASFKSHPLLGNGRPLKYLFNHLNLPAKARRSTLNQWYICGKTHTIDMPPSIKIIERIEDDVEAGKPVHIELIILDIRVMRLDLCSRLEFMRHFLCYLLTIIIFRFCNRLIH